MKTVFKPLGLAAAVAAVTAGYTGAVSAQAVSARHAGDLALIPFYTVQSGFATAMHITNTSEQTQIVKLRARRGLDSADSLDFNIIMSPKDQWVGSMTKQADDTIIITSNDNTCTAPAGTPAAGGGVKFVMPDNTSVSTLVNFREQAEEGYVEIIAMAQPVSESEPIAVQAEHVGGVPRDCTLVRSNFFRSTTGSDKGVHTPSFTAQTCTDDDIDDGDCDDDPGTDLERNDYEDSQDDALTVSWAVTDGDSGLEFGSNAEHIEGFAAEPMMTNQQVILAGQVDPLGYLFPDLDGGSPVVGTRGLYDTIIRPLLGVPSVRNDWSSRASADFTVATDWVVTMPGQYLMVNPEQYLESLETADLSDSNDLKIFCFGKDLADAEDEEECDYRDIPVGLAITFYNREEEGFTPEEGGLVVSPAINLTPDGITLPFETNVIEWNVNAGAVLSSQYGVTFSPQFEFDRGWASLGVTPAATKDQQVWDYTLMTDPNDPTDLGGPVPVVNPQVPIVGFAVWERNFAATPLANYGRAIDHSWGS